MKLRYLSVACLVVTALVLSLTACAKSQPAAPAPGGAPAAAGKAAAPITFRISNAEGPANTSVKHLWAAKLKELLDQKAAGRLKVEYYHSAQLYADAEALVALVQGTLDATTCSIGLLTTYNPKVVAGELYGLILSPDQGMKFISGSKAQKDIIEPLLARGIDAGILFTQPQTIWTKKPIEKLSDLKGLKIRTMPGKGLVAGAKALGMNALQLPVPEVYTAVQQGTVDAVNTLDLMIKTNSLQEVLKYNLEEPATHISANAQVLGTASLKKMSPDLAAIVKQAHLDAMKYAYDELQVRVRKETRDFLDKAGMKYTRLSAEDKKTFYEMTQTSWAEFIPTIGQDFIDEALKYRQ